MQQTIGEQIKEARISKGYSQLKLASIVNLSIDTISGIESGRKTNVSIGTLKLIGDELNLKFEI